MLGWEIEMNTKFYEVTVIATKTVVVEVEINGRSEEETKQEASDFAFQEAITGCGQIDVQSVLLLKTEHQIEQSKRLADEVFEL